MGDTLRTVGNSGIPGEPGEECINLISWYSTCQKLLGGGGGLPGSIHILALHFFHLPVTLSIHLYEVQMSVKLMS